MDTGETGEAVVSWHVQEWGVEDEQPESPVLPLNLEEDGIAVWLMARTLWVTYRCAPLYESTISYMAVSTSLQLNTEQWTTCSTVHSRPGKLQFHFQPNQRGWFSSFRGYWQCLPSHLFLILWVPNYALPCNTSYTFYDSELFHCISLFVPECLWRMFVHFFVLALRCLACRRWWVHVCWVIMWLSG